MNALVFLTLFLGLVDGRHMVELAAAEETHRVEVHLDGELQATIYGGPPWKAPVELGDELAPHRLEAIARDAEGRELGRAEQWVNLPRARAEVSLLVDLGDPGEASVEIGWKAVEQEDAESVRLELDGVPVPVGEWQGSSIRVDLPPHDPGTLHVVTAEVVFPGPVTARADVAFGAPYGDEVATELTGVAVEVDGRRRLRRAADAGPWLRAGGETLRVVAVDEGEADLYAVVDAGAHPQLDLLAVRLGQRLRARQGPRQRITPQVGSVLASSPLRQTGMREGDRLYLVRPQVEAAVGNTLLFGISPPLDDSKGGSAWQLSTLRLDPYAGRPQRLAEAVATAGMRATSASRPRGMVLILGPGAEDESGLTPARVRAYLDRLGVPLMVLYVDLLSEDEAARRRGLEEARRRWGPDVADVADADDWLRLFSDLRGRLAHQRVLWVEGRHLPHEVSFAGAPEWLRRVDGSGEAR